MALPTGSTGAPPSGPTKSGSPQTTSLAPTSTIGKFTQGWYMFGAITAGILLGGTPIAPVIAGILTLSLVYQTSLLLQHK